jgi:hypothetical protein
MAGGEPTYLVMRSGNPGLMILSTMPENSSESGTFPGYVS